MKWGYELHTLKVEFLYMRNYSYILVDNATRQGAVVDPAWDLGLIEGTLRSLDVDLKLIMLTHSHHDHVNKVEPLLDIYPAARVYMSAIEIDTYGYRCKNLIPFDDGEAVWLGETPITPLVTPGHTAGGACFLLENDLLSGDTLFIDGCGVCTGAGSSAQQMYHSFQKIRRMVSSHVRVHPGHSYGKEPGVPLHDVLSNNIYFQFDKEEQFVRFRMRRNQGKRFHLT